MMNRDKCSNQIKDNRLNGELAFGSASLLLLLPEGSFLCRSLIGIVDQFFLTGQNELHLHTMSDKQTDKRWEINQFSLACDERWLIKAGSKLRRKEVKILIILRIFQYINMSFCSAGAINSTSMKYTHYAMWLSAYIHLKSACTGANTRKTKGFRITSAN